MRSRFSKGDDVGGDLALSLLRDAQLSVCRAVEFSRPERPRYHLRGFILPSLTEFKGFPEGRFQVLAERSRIFVSFAVAC